MELSLLQLLGLLGSLIAALLISFIAVYSLYLLYIHSQYDHLPGPKRTSFFLGNAKAIADGFAGPKDMSNEDKPLIFQKFENWVESYGDTYVVFILHRVIVCTRSPEAIKTILVHGDQHKFTKPASLFQGRYLFGVRYLADGLASEVNHDAWYPRRKALDPVFHKKQLLLAVDAFNVSGDIFMKELQQHADVGDTFCLMDTIHRATLDVIMRFMFSMDNEHLHTKFHGQAHEFVEKSFDAMQTSMGGFFPSALTLLLHRPGYRKEIRDLLISFRKIGENIIKERQVLMESGAVVPEDLLTTMIRAYNDPSVGYTMDILVDEFVTIVIAGMETSANTLSLLIMELGRQPQLWKRLVEEVDEVVGHRSHVTSDDITKLTFTHQLIKETLRLYPPVTGIVREIKDQCTLDGYKIPAQTICLLLISAANKNSNLVNDPLTFDPDRFSPSAEKKVSSYSYLPFSLGPRNCIGQVFAQMEMKVMLAKFAQHFRFKLDESESFSLGQRATIFPASNLMGVIVPR